MKRTLSLLLALVMVLGTFTTVFAAPSTDVDKAEFLESLGILKGDGKGDLFLGDDLTREQGLVMLARLLGEEEVAEEFPVGEDYPFVDVEDNYYVPFVAWAFANGFTKGIGADKFGYKQPLLSDQYAAFLLRALGYEEEGTDVYESAFELALDLGLLEESDAVEGSVLKRGTMAVLTFNALGTEVNGSEETLADKLDVEMPEEEVELSTDIEITAAKAVANDKVEVKVEEEVDASVADFAIVKKGTTTEVEVKGLVKESAKVFVLETEALTAGTAYTVKANGKSLNFTGVAVDKTAPTVKSAKGTDTNRFEVEFSDVMDKATAENVENYVFDKDLQIVNVSLDGGRKVVELETDSAKKNTTYKLTVENVTNSDGVVMKKFTQNLRAVEYTGAPTVSGLPGVLSNTLVEVTFNEGPFGMNKESLEAVENYEIEGLDVVEAKAYDRKGNDGLYDTVLLTTEEQEANKAYKLTIAGVTDDSVLNNVIKTKTFTFRGMRADKTPPTMVGNPDAKNANVVELEFYDTSALDVASVEDLSNYKITYRDGADTVELAVLEAESWSDGYPDAYYEAQGVTLLTEEQDDKVTYTIEISGVEDEYGNAMKLVKRTFKGSEIDVTPPTVKSVKHTGSTVVVEFTEKNDLVGEIAKDPTNYTIDGVGTAISATAKAAEGFKVVTLKTGDLTANKPYKLIIENIEDEFGNLMPKKTVSFIAVASSLDTTPPIFAYAYAENSFEVHINFDEAVTEVTAPTVEDIGITLLESGFINDGTTIVYKVSGGTMENETYTFDNGVFKDAAGNQMDIIGETFVGVKNVANEAPEVEYDDQVNVKTIVLTFNEPVKLNTTADQFITDLGPKGTAKKLAASKNTHETEWKIVFDVPLVYDKEYTLNSFTANVKDLGDKAPTSNYKFVANYYDDVAPSVVGVEAVDNKTVIVEYDEDLKQAGTYKIYYIDEKTGKEVPKTVTGTLTSDASKVSLSYNTKGSMVYYLSTKVGSMDLAGKREEIDNFEWDFLGTDVLATGSYVTGVSIINATDVEVSATFDIAGIKVYEVDEDKVETFIVSDLSYAGTNST
ncbi:MAG: Ig-like domain-containing protein, partial [Tissierellaceae bacterium]